MVKGALAKVTVYHGTDDLSGYFQYFGNVNHEKTGPHVRPSSAAPRLQPRSKRKKKG